MGGKQSRVETSDVETELKQQAERQGETQATISITPALVAQLNDTSEPSNTATAVVFSPEQEAFVKQQLQDAYRKGAADFRKEQEAKQKKAAAMEPAKQAQLAQEQEASESAKVQRLVDELNRKKYRAPLNDVQCAPERDACLQCYRDKESNILHCKEVADAFIRCAQQTTEHFVKEN